MNIPVISRLVVTYPACTLAWAYIKSSSQDPSIKTMAYISFFSMLIATMTLVIGIGVITGFQKATYTQLKTIHADLQITNNGEPLDWKSIQGILGSHEAIDHSAPTSINYVMLKVGETYITSPVMLKAIDSDYEQSNFFHQKKALGEHEISMGNRLASALGITEGESVELLYADQHSFSHNTISFTTYKARVQSLITTGISDIDESLLLCSFKLFKKIAPELGITMITVMAKPGYDLLTVKQDLSNRLAVDVHTWEELYPALRAALQLETYATCTILLLVVILASIILMALLYMIITHKKRDIAILHAMGIGHTKITRVFLIIGWLLALSGSFCGVALSYASMYVLTTYNLITLPEAYYISTLPLETDWQTCGALIMVVTLLSSCAMLLPLRSIRYTTIARILKQE
jgi:ABC-type lipoprotein release transport system permease subunit